MNKREITLWMDELEYDALRRALLARDTDPRAEMQKWLDACYRKLVPKQEREQIARAASGHRDKDSAALRVIEDGECRCFRVADDGVDAADAASRLRQYLDGGGAGGFAARFVPQTPMTEMAYIDHVMDCLCDFERPANVLHIDLDSGTFSALDAESGWWTYPINDAADSVRGGLPGKDASREQRTAWLRQKLDGKRIGTDERCYLLRGDRALRASDVDILDYVGTEDGIATFTLELRTDLETVFGTRIAKDDDTYVEIYASYDANKSSMCRRLDIGLLRELDSVYFLYEMDEGTADAIMRKIDDYCMEEDGLHLADWFEQNARPQPWHEMT